MRAVVTGDDLPELPPAPLAERLTPALVVDRPDPLVQRRIEVSLGVLEIGRGSRRPRGAALRRTAGGSTSLATPRATLRAPYIARELPQPPQPSGREQLAPLAAAVTEHAVAVVAVERDAQAAFGQMRETGVRRVGGRGQIGDHGYLEILLRVPGPGVAGHDLELCVRRVGDRSCVGLLRGVGEVRERDVDERERPAEQSGRRGDGGRVDSAADEDPRRPFEAPIHPVEQARPELVLGLLPVPLEAAEERARSPVAALGRRQIPRRVQGVAREQPLDAREAGLRVVGHERCLSAQSGEIRCADGRSATSGDTSVASQRLWPMTR